VRENRLHSSEGGEDSSPSRPLSGFLGAVRSIVHLVTPTERAGLMAAYYVESYLANSLPTILAGYMAQRLGLVTVANLYGGGIVLLALTGLALAFMHFYQARRTLKPDISD